MCDDGSRLQPREIHQYLSRVLYARRSKVNPLWNQLVIGGVGNDNTPFLGLVDLYGSAYQDNTIATGYGAYIAQPLLRKAWRPDLTEAEAQKIAIDALRVLLYRDARSLDKVRQSSRLECVLTAVDTSCGCKGVWCDRP